MRVVLSLAGAVVAAIICTSAQAADDPADIFKLGRLPLVFTGGNRFNLEVSKEGDAVTCTLAYSRSGKIGEEGGGTESVDVKDCGYYEQARTVRITTNGHSSVFALRGTLSAAKNSIFWRPLLHAVVQFKDGRSEEVVLRGALLRLQDKPGCFLAANAAATPPHTISIDLTYAHDDEEYVSRLATQHGWSLLERSTNYRHNIDRFKIAVGTNDGLHALELLSKEERVNCARYDSDDVADRPAPALR